MSHTPVPISKTPFVLLGLLTVLTVGGPVVITQTIKGGASPGWPPDRPVEWWTFGLVTGAVLILMTACLAIGLVNWRKTLAKRPQGPQGGSLMSTPVDESFNSD
ncbi:hypothetical protein [Singulisphaera acidiphila]|uniref:Uncharacterized protein n=1 Tax=Singulisphaera acidiphila (strain ATCC BAA-1392 / DSM 18658 / VKM B-2454 / MOB10) TaxID=886293 RepID=L0D9I6_SINAD|nr:hypothetical protein [Singulisphaera acidiphila]AGA25530.1 hypothetical protein Sinac_1134 [Singulisphaera acidiphila DSM 18658]